MQNDSMADLNSPAPAETVTNPNPTTSAATDLFVSVGGATDTMAAAFVGQQQSAAEASHQSLAATTSDILPANPIDDSPSAASHLPQPQPTPPAGANATVITTAAAAASGENGPDTTVPPPTSNLLTAAAAVPSAHGSSNGNAPNFPNNSGMVVVPQRHARILVGGGDDSAVGTPQLRSVSAHQSPQLVASGAGGQLLSASFNANALLSPSSFANNNPAPLTGSGSGGLAANAAARGGASSTSPASVPNHPNASPSFAVSSSGTPALLLNAVGGGRGGYSASSNAAFSPASPTPGPLGWNGGGGGRSAAHNPLSGGGGGGGAPPAQISIMTPTDEALAVAGGAGPSAARSLPPLSSSHHHQHHQPQTGSASNNAALRVGGGATRQSPFLSNYSFSSARQRRAATNGVGGGGSGADNNSSINNNHHADDDRAPLAGGGGGGGAFNGSFAAVSPPLLMSTGADGGGGDFNFGLSFGGGAARAHAAAVIAARRSSSHHQSIALSSQQQQQQQRSSTAVVVNAGVVDYDDISKLDGGDEDGDGVEMKPKGKAKAAALREADGDGGTLPSSAANNNNDGDGEVVVISAGGTKGEVDDAKERGSNKGADTSSPPPPLSLEERRRIAREERLAWAATLSPHDPRRAFTMRFPDGLLPEGSIGGSAFNLATNTLGAGTIALPGAFAAAGGVLGLAVLIICLIAAIYAMRLQCVVAEQTGMASYALKARLLVGPWAEKFMAVIVIILCWGVTIVYVVSIGDLLDTFRLYDGAPEVMRGDWGRRLVVTLFWLITMLPLSLPAQINSLRYASLAGLGATGVLIAALMAYAATAEQTVLRPVCGGTDGGSVIGLAPVREQIASTSNIPIANFDLSAVMALPVFIFGTACHTNTYNVYSELSDRSPRRMTIVAIVTFISVGLLYLSCGLTGVAIFGEDTKGNILSNFEDPLGQWYITVAFVGMAITLTAAFPLCVFPARDALLQLACGYAPGEVVPTHVRVPMSGLIAVISLLFGLFVPGVKIMFGLLGGLLGSSVVYIWPAIFAMRTKTWTPAVVGWANIIGAWVLLVFGVLAAIFGTALSIYDLV